MRSARWDYQPLFRMLQGGAPPPASDSTVFRLDGPWLKIAASRKGPLLFVGGQQGLATLELLRLDRTETRDGDDTPQFSFKRRLNLSSQHSAFRQAGAGALRCTAVCWHPNSDRIAASSTGTGMIMLWDAADRKNGNLIGKLPPNVRQKAGSNLTHITAIQFVENPSTKTTSLVSAAQDGSLSLWQLGDLLNREETTGADSVPSATDSSIPLGEKHPKKGNTSGHGAINDLHVQSGAGNDVVLAQSNGIGLYDLAQMKSVHHYYAWHREVRSARFHPRFPSIAAAATGDSVRIVDSRVKGDRGVLPTPMKAVNPIGCVRWRPDHDEQLATNSSPDAVSGGTRMAAGLLVWDLRKPLLPLHQFKERGDQIQDFLWADMNHLISCYTGTVELHSVTNSHQPRKLMCCSAATWAVSPQGGESLVATAEAPEREAEPAEEHTQSLRHLEALVAHRGFEPDIVITDPKCQATDRESTAFVEELKRAPDFLRCLCSRFVRGHDSPAGKPSEEESSLRFLARLAPIRPPPQGLSATELCRRAAEESRTAGMPSRSRTWQLLAEVLSADGWAASPEELLPTALLPPTGAGGGGGLYRTTSNPVQMAAGGRSRGAGARWVSAQDPLDRHPSGDGGHELEAPELIREGSVSREEASTEWMAKESLRQWRSAWVRETLRHMLNHYEERNDVSMLLSMVAVLGVGPNPDAAVAKKIVRWTQGAADVLSRMKAFVSRASLLRSTYILLGSGQSGLVSEVHEMAQRKSRFHFRCAGCKQDVEALRGLHARAASRRASSGAAGGGAGHRSAPSCNKCQARQTPPCAICGKEVKGIFVACQTCGHGGHPAHVREWFSKEQKCPAGCGHVCFMTSPARKSL